MNILIGNAWPYANGPLHLGRIAVLLPGDILARYHRTMGDDVIFLSGTDCHGTPVTMKAKEEGKIALSVIRMVRNSIKNAEINGKCELDDAGVSVVIAKEMKQRKESLAEFEKAGRQDLADETKAEMAVLEKYMPKQLTPEEVEQIVRDAIAGQDVATLKMGDVMKLVMPKVKGKADGSLVSKTVKEILQNK